MTRARELTAKQITLPTNKQMKSEQTKSKNRKLKKFLDATSTMFAKCDI
jgi:hypothetical protein